MKNLLFSCFLLLCTLLPAEERELRTWTSKVGTTIEAKLVAEKMGYIRLEKADGELLTVKLDQLIREDRMYVEQATEVRGETTIEGIPAEPGSYSEQIACGPNGEWHYYLYLPKDFHTGREWPVWFIMSPGGGKNPSVLSRYKEGADFLGCILALSVESKNGVKGSIRAMNAMADDVYQTLPVAKDLGFASGFSGGSRAAYLLSETNQNIAGVLACGSGGGVYLEGGDFRHVNLRSGTYIYSLMGSNCFNRTEAFQSHKEFPKDFRLRYFPGKHDWAQKELITEGMARVMGAGLEEYDGEDADKFRRDFARTLWAWTETQVDTSPWEAAYWADYLKDFPAEAEIRSQASVLSQKLAADPRVQKARKAEKDIQSFSEEYFQIDTRKDRLENQDRLKAAEAMAEDYADEPYAELLRRLGEKS